MSVKRFDTGELSSPKVLPNGFVRLDGYLTRAGVFSYRQSDQTIRREYRPASEVFHEDSMDSLALAPFTLQHPPFMLDANNAKDWACGAVGEPRQDGMKLRGPIQVTDSDAIEAITKGGISEISCGYTCDLLLEPGEFEGEKYDAIQTNIRYNHVSAVRVGRAGPEVRVRLDDAGYAESQTEEPTVTVKVKIDGVDFEVSEQAAQALSKVQARADAVGAEVESLKAENTKITARFDQEKDRADKAEAKLKEVTTATKTDADDRFDAEVQERVGLRLQLERDALKVLKADADLSTKSDTEVRKMVILAISPGAESKLDDASDIYITARFDQAMETLLEEARADAEVEDLQKTVIESKVPVEKKDSAEDLLKKNQAAAIAKFAAGNKGSM